MRLFLGMTLGVPIVVLLMLFTQPGTRALLDLVDDWTAVGVAYRSGTLASSLQLSSLTLSTASVDVSLQDVDLALEPRCIWQSAICLRYLHASNLEIDISDDTPDESSGESPGQIEADNGALAFPVPVQTSDLAVGSMSVKWPGGAWQQLAMRGEVTLSGSTVTVPIVRVQRSRLELHASDDTATGSIEPQPLSPVVLPFTLEVGELELLQPQWDFYGAVYTQDTIALQGCWSGSNLQLDKLEVISAQQGELELQGEIAFADEWPLSARMTSTIAPPLVTTPLLGRQVNLSAQGSLAALELEIEWPGAVSLAAQGVVNLLDSDLAFGAQIVATSATSLPLTELAQMPDELADLNVVAPLTLSASGSLRQQSFNLHGELQGLGYTALRVMLEGRHEAGTVNLAQIELKDEASASEIQGSGTLTLAEQVQWTLALESPGIQLPEVGTTVRGRLAGHLTVLGDAKQEQWQVQVTDMDLAGEVNAIPASLRGHVGVDSNLQLLRSALNATVNEAELTVV